MRENDVIRSIIVLSIAISPPAIIRLIAHAVINAIDAHPIRSFTHISEKIFKFLPATTNRYRSIRPIFSLHAGFHATPNNIRPGVMHTVRSRPVTCRQSTSVRLTTTMPNHAGSQWLRCHISDATTVANTLPVDPLPSRFRFRGNCEHSISFPGQLNPVIGLHAFFAGIIFPQYSSLRSWGQDTQL